MESVSLDIKLEGILFYKAAPVKFAALCKLLDVSAEELNTAITALRTRLASGATRLIVSETEASLVTAPDLDSLIEQLRKDDLKRDIGKAGAETLAIVLYQGPVSRGDIDRVRGVNSSYILRNLMVRGLVEKTSNPKRIEYQITTELLAHLGITNKRELPQYNEIVNTLATYAAEAD